jgi:hypothetical protein
VYVKTSAKRHQQRSVSQGVLLLEGFHRGDETNCGLDCDAPRLCVTFGLFLFWPAPESVDGQIYQKKKEKWAENEREKEEATKMTGNTTHKKGKYIYIQGLVVRQILPKLFFFLFSFHS